jgi:hypothetical protein
MYLFLIKKKEEILIEYHWDTVRNERYCYQKYHLFISSKLNQRFNLLDQTNYSIYVI